MMGLPWEKQSFLLQIGVETFVNSVQQIVAVL